MARQSMETNENERKRVQFARLNASNLVLLIGLEVFILFLAVFITRSPIMALLATVLGCFCVVVVAHRMQYGIKPEDLEDPNALRQKTYSGVETLRIRTIDRRKFIQLIETIYYHYGFQTRIVDELVEARWRGELTLIQALRRSTPAEDVDVQDLARAMVKKKAAHGVLICTGGFSKKAKLLANRRGIQLIELDELMRMIDHIQSKKEVKIL